MPKLLILFLMLSSCATEQLDTSYLGLSEFAGEFNGGFEAALPRHPVGEMSTGLLPFRVDGLLQFALLIKPTGDKPQKGWPVVVFNHGYVPVAANHGMNKASGKRDRPGDYYRGIPEEFARNGFLVIAPDYRGHADSEGNEFVAAETPTLWYTRDVVGLVKSISSLSEADKHNVFMVGHSMGSAITLNVLSVFGGEVKAASLWSPSKSHYLSDDSEEPTAETFLKRISTPLNIHHAINDPVTPFVNSQRIAQGIQQGNPGMLYEYASDHHLIEGDDRVEAFRRDIKFFKALYQNE